MSFIKLIRKKISGMLSLEFRSNNIRNKIYNFRVKLLLPIDNFNTWYQERRADVIIISFPKCGRTWLRLMIGKAIETHFNLNNADILELTPLSKINDEIPSIFLNHEDSPENKKASDLSKSKKNIKIKKLFFCVGIQEMY